MGAATPTAPKAVLVSQTEDEISVRFALNGFATKGVATPRGSAFVIEAPKMASMLEEGAPDLPLFALSLAIGDRDAMEVEVKDLKYDELKDIEIAPSKGNLSRSVHPDEVPYSYGEVYAKDDFYPEHQAILDAPYILRDVRGQNILVYPFAYNPVTKVLRVYKEMTLVLHKTGEEGANPKLSRKAAGKVSPATEAMYTRRFINYRERAAKYTFIEDEGETMVICADAYLAAMQPYVDWKNQSGRPTTLYSLSEIGGNNYEAIKAFILSHYNDPDENLCFVLLVGDCVDLTPRAANGGRSDIWFGQLEGNDYYPEVFVGRFSAESVEDVEHQVAKVIYYERDMPADADWLGKGIGIGSVEGTGSGHNGGESDYEHIDYIRDTLLHYTYHEVSQHYVGVGVGTNAAMLTENFNAGAGICNYCNHGSVTGWYAGSFSNSHVNALVNDYKWPFIWSTACLNGKFDEDCFAEAWMRATDNVTGVPTGAIGGMFSWILQPWQPPMTGQDEMVDVLCEWRSADQFHHTLAGASLNGNMKILDLHPSDQGDTHNTWILFGDPSLMLRTAAPQPVNVLCQPEVIFLDQTQLHLTADADYALATLTIDGNVVCTTPIVNGEATLTFDSPEQEGTALLVVTGFNKVTHVQQLDVIPASGAYLTFDSYAINSPSGQADYGETFTVDVTVKNIGNATASDVQVRLLTTLPLIEILDGEASIPEIAPMEQYTLEGAFTLKVADVIEDGTPAELILDCQSGSLAWASSFRMTLHAPRLELADFRPAANVGSGESSTLIVSIRNAGSAAARNARVELYSSSTDIVLNETAHQLWDIPSGETATAHFHFTVGDGVTMGSSYEMMYVAEAEQYLLEGTDFLNVGASKETFETGDFSAFDWQTLGSAYWYVDNSTAHTGLYSARSGAIGHSNVTTLQIAVEVTTAGQISFFKKLCTEADKDKLTFYIDSQPVNVWSGEIGWSQETYNVEAGTHTFKWIYMKNGSGSYGEDACWIDDIQFPAASIIEMIPGPELHATVDHNRVTLTWESLGSDYEYIVRCDGAYLTTQSATSFTEVRGDGTYLYSVSAKRQNQLTAPYFLLVEVGILDVAESLSELQVYPNPTQGMLTLSMSGDATPRQMEYSLFNLTGQRVLSGTFEGSVQLNLASQPKGLYVLQLVCDGQTITRKVVVR